MQAFGAMLDSMNCMFFNWVAYHFPDIPIRASDRDLKAAFQLFEETIHHTETILAPWRK